MFHIFTRYQLERTEDLDAKESAVFEEVRESGRILIAIVAIHPLANVVKFFLFFLGDHALI